MSCFVILSQSIHVQQKRWSPDKQTAHRARKTKDLNRERLAMRILGGNSIQENASIGAEQVFS
jgi:hypothetical protein